MYRIKTQNGELVNALSFHFDGKAKTIYADVDKDAKEFKLDDCIVCGTYSRARVTNVFNEMVEAFKKADSAAMEDFIYVMPEA